MSEWGRLRLNYDDDPPTVYIEDVEEPALVCSGGMSHHHDEGTDHTNCGICRFTAIQNEHAIIIGDAMRRMLVPVLREKISGFDD